MAELMQKKSRTDGGKKMTGKMQFAIGVQSWTAVFLSENPPDPKHLKQAPTTTEGPSTSGVAKKFKRTLEQNIITKQIPAVQKKHTRDKGKKVTGC